MSTLKTDQPKTEQPKSQCTVFLDRTHGKVLGSLLRRVGFKVKSIYEVYPKKKHERTSDPTWIKRCGTQHWVAISGDKRLETNVENVKAVIDSKCRVFILSDSNSLPEEWAAAVIVGKDKFYNIIQKYEGPFFASVSKQAGSHICRLRFPKSGGEDTEPREQSGT